MNPVADGGSCTAGPPGPAARRARSMVPSSSAVLSLLLLPWPAGAETADPKAPVSFEVMYRADGVSVLSGGLRRKTTALGNADVKAGLDLEQLAGWSGASAFLHVISGHGGKPNARNVGSGQGVDNLEVRINTTKVFQAWAQQTWRDGELSALAGLYDLNSEFYNTATSALFLHPAPGIGSELAQTGRNGPSIYPTSSFGVRLRYAPTETTYLQAVVLDGVPGSPTNPRGTHVQFNGGDGTLRVAEAGWAGAQEGDGPYKFALGAWSYTAAFADLVDLDAAGQPRRHKGNQGWYAIAERPFGAHLAGFLRGGRADPDINQYVGYVQAGLVYRGLFEARPADQIGIAVSTARNGEKFRRAARASGVERSHQETAYELTYRAPLTPRFALQGVLQYISRPGSDKGLNDAVVAGLRLEWAWGN